MPSFNRTILMGHVTRDPDFKTLQGGTTLASFGLAVNKKWKTSTGEARESVMFIDCTIFGKGAEIVNKYVRKGDLFHVEGELRQETWEDKNGGGKRSKISLVIENFQLMGNKRDEQDQTLPPARQQSRPAPAPAEPEPEYQDNDIPF